MDLRQLRYFVAVAEELHFGRAAHRVGIAQPPLSQQISRLEAELQVKLLERTKRRVQLTGAGSVFLEEARRTLLQAERAAERARRASRGEIGELVVGFVPIADLNVLPIVLPTFRQRYPDVRLILRSLSSTPLLEAVHDSRIEVGFVHLSVEDEVLVMLPILREPLVVALPETHRLTAYRRVPLQKLAREPFILLARQSARIFHDLVLSVCRQAGFSVNVVQEADHLQTSLGLVAAGLGVSLVTASVQSILPRKGVAYRPLLPPAPQVEMAVVYRQNNPSEVLRAFLDVVRDATPKPANRTRVGVR